ncbi:hypothetical protein [Sneathiella glossodoripedis]|uniref:terminase small subunit-like protein n=1 Tax=Sneathiella glossodoripedis TaxID=418853 RepID=UPI00046F8BA7|nr:hypothetical protein [Sneathiella glossodoripedis]
MGLPGLTEGLARLKALSLRKFQQIKDMGGVLDWLQQPSNQFSAVALREVFFPEAEAQAVRRFLADMFAGEIILIADQKELGENERSDTQSSGKATSADNSETVARSKLRIDIRRWLMEQFSPAIYGPNKNTGSMKDKGKEILNSIRAKVYLPENGRDANAPTDLHSDPVSKRNS